MDSGLAVRCLSLWQPWATLWLSDLKHGETRHFSNKFTGLVVIHATQHLEREACRDEVIAAALESIGFGDINTLPRGAAIGTCMLQPAKRVEEVRDIVSLRELSCGNFSDGRFWWPADHKEPFAQPVPLRGQQSVPWTWHVPVELEPIFDYVRPAHGN